jgi:hypothetical protein
MTLSAAEFLRHNVVLDESRRIIFIPKLCESTGTILLAIRLEHTERLPATLLAVCP